MKYNDLNKKNVLIESGGGIGYLIMFTPALRRLKEIYPDCCLTFLTNEKNADVLRRLPYINSVVTIKKGGLFARLKVLPELKKQDYMIFTEWQPHLMLASWILRLPNRYSVPRMGNPVTRTLDKQITNTVSSSDLFAAETNAKMISELLDIRLDGDMTKCDVSLPDDRETKSAAALLEEIGIAPNDKFLLISPFTGDAWRDWNLHEAKKLVNYINDKYHLPVLFIGNKKDNAVLEGISQYSLLQQTTLMQLIAIIKRAGCIISCDSGPAHIAGALRVPCIDLFGRGWPSRWAPKHNCFPIFLNYDCCPCSDDLKKKCPYDYRCIRTITADMVIDKLKQILD